MPERLKTLLRMAYAVEQKSIDVLQRQIETARNFCAQERLKSHLVETQWQVNLLKACFEFLETDNEPLESEVPDIICGIAHPDLFTMKRIEIKLYKQIMSAARKAQAPDVLQACREILEQERAMAEWIEDSLLDAEKTMTA